MLETIVLAGASRGIRNVLAFVFLSVSDWLWMWRNVGETPVLRSSGSTCRCGCQPTECRRGPSIDGSYISCFFPFAGDNDVTSAEPIIFIQYSASIIR